MITSNTPDPMSSVSLTHVYAAVGVLTLCVIGGALIDITVLWVALGIALITGAVPLVVAGIARDFRRATDLFS